MNNQNLKPFKANSEETVKNARKAGIASGKARAQRKTMKDSLGLLVALGSKPGKVTPTEKLKVMSKDAIEKANLSQEDLINIALVNQAKKGKPDAIRLLREILGEDQPEPTATVSSLDGLAAELERYKEDGAEDDSEPPADQAKPE